MTSTPNRSIRKTIRLSFIMGICMTVVFLLLSVTITPAQEHSGGPKMPLDTKALIELLLEKKLISAEDAQRFLLPYGDGAVEADKMEKRASALS